jgi:hypothetical protein
MDASCNSTYIAFWSENLKVRDSFRDWDIDGRILLYTVCSVVCVENEVCWLHKSAGCMRKTLTETQYRVKVTCFCFISCMNIFLGDSRLMGERFLMHCNTITNSTTIYCNGTYMSEADG